MCCKFCNSCSSVFPESPRWLMATSQIPRAKKCLQSFSARNGMCVSDELYPAETLLSGKISALQTSATDLRTALISNSSNYLQKMSKTNFVTMDHKTSHK